MSRRYKGGVISATAPTTSTSVATGVWTLNQQMVAIVGSGWPFQPVGWIGTLTSSNSSISGRAVALDSSNNVYLCGRLAVSGGYNEFQIAKYDNLGNIQWQRRLGAQTGTSNGNSIAADSLGNIYVCGSSNVSNNNDWQIAKYNSSGSIQWQRRLTAGIGQNDAYSIGVDSSNNVYVFGDSALTGSQNFVLAKYNTSGTIQWQRSLGDSGYEQASAVAIDSSGNAYICGLNATGATGLQVAKYNTSGAIQWQRKLSGGVTNYGNSIATDSSGNAYVCGFSNESGTPDFLIAKYDTSGTLQWQRRLGGGFSETGRSVAVNSSGDVYVCGESTASGNNDIHIAKYNSSGSIQWQRKLSGSTSGSELGYAITVDSSDNFYICGQSINSATYTIFLFAKFPGDGSATGTYAVGGISYTYSASTLTDAALSLTPSTTTLTDAASGLTDVASSLTDAASTLTSSVTPI